MARQEDVHTGTSDVTYNLVSVIYHALQGAENYEIYAKDADQTGDREFAQYFRDLKDQEMKRAEKAKDMLSKHLKK